IMSLETGVLDNFSPDMYLHALGVSEIWTGDNISFSGNVGEPFVKYSIVKDSVLGYNSGGNPIIYSDAPESLNYLSGYSGRYKRFVDTNLVPIEYLHLQYIDTLNSEYETHITAGALA